MTICQLYQPRVLARDTIKFKNVYEHQMWNVDYIYEVELVSLNDLVGEHSVVHTKEFKEFAKEELEKKKNMVYDEDVNIRDLYPIDIHFNNKKKDDIERFNKLNDIILSNSDNISRRVTKKEIVYKKNKSRSILAFKIRAHGGINIFTFKDIEKYDVYNKFITISKKNCKPLEKCFCIKSDDDLKYIELVIDKYLSIVLDEKYGK